MKNLVLACFGLVLFFQGMAQQKDTLSYSLEDCVKYALENHPDVKNIKIDEKIYTEKVHQVRSAGLPQINGEVQYQYYAYIPTSLIPNFFGGKPNEYIPVQFGVPHNWSAGANASQLIFSGSYLVGLQAAKTVTELARKNTTRQEVDTRLAVNKAFYTTLLTQENIRLIDLNLVRLDSTLRTMKAMNTAGYLDQLSIDRIEVTKNNLLIERQKLNNLIALTLNLLKFQMSMPMETPLKLKGTLTVDQAEPLPTTSEKVDATQRSEYKLLETQLKLNTLSLKAVKAEYLPSLAAFSTVNLSGPNQKFYVFNYGQRWYPTVIIGAKISVPIFDGLNKVAKANEAKLTLLKTQNSMTRFEQAVQLEATNARTSYLNAISTLDIQKKNITLAQEVYRVTQEKNKAGKASYLEITDADNALKTAQLNYSTAQYDVIIARIDYLKALGKLN